MISQGFMVRVTFSEPHATSALAEVSNEKKLVTFDSMVYDINTIAQGAPSRLAGAQSMQISLITFLLVKIPKIGQLVWVPYDTCTVIDEISFKTAFDRFAKELREDDSLRVSYHANIAMAFIDAYHDAVPEETVDLHVIANTAARRFIDNLLREDTR